MQESSTQSFGLSRRASSSGSESNEVSLNEAARIKQRQAARRSKSDRIQGAKPRVKRRERNPALDLAGDTRIFGSSNDTDALLRKAPSAGRLLGVSQDTLDTAVRSGRALSGSKPPIPVITTPDTSPTFGRKVNATSKQVAAKTRITERSTAVRGRDTSHRRSGSVRATTSRKSAFLDVPDTPAATDKDQNRNDPNDDSYCLRSFDLTRKGVVNRGDSFRRRRSRSNSLAPNHQQQLQDFLDQRVSSSSSPRVVAEPEAVAAGILKARPRTQDHGSSYRVAIIGAHGVGKTALISQFMTSECINAYDRTRSEDEQEQPVFVMLNGEESELIFSNFINIKDEMNRTDLPDAYVLMYSVIDKGSFQRVEDQLARLHNWGALRGRALLIVGNKTDLVRSRAVSAQDGKCLALAYRGKFIEISVVINHNVDELLVGILTQIRLKKEVQQAMGDPERSSTTENSSDSSSASWMRNKSLVRASMKAKQVFSWFFGKDDEELNSCENLQIL